MTGARANVVVRWTTRLVLLALLVVIAAAVAVLLILPRAVHGAALDVLTGSMTPAIPAGSIVLVRPVDPGTLHVGDVVTYQRYPNKPKLITHRIVAIDAHTNPVMFTTKGDANRGADVDPVPAAAIRGKVWFHVPHLGAIRDSLHTGGGLARLAIPILAIYALLQAGSAVRDRRQDRAGAAGDISSADQVGRPHERSAIVATLPAKTFRSMSPKDTAVLLRARLLDQSTAGFRVAFEQAECELPELLSAMRRLGASDIQTVGVTTPATESAIDRLRIASSVRTEQLVSADA